MEKIKNILIPFEGFYESLASQRVDDIIFRNFVSEYNIEENQANGWLDTPDDMEDKDQNKFWDEYYPKHVSEERKNLIDHYIKEFNDAVGINVKFQELNSPRFYNYTTDRLFVDVPENELIDLYNKTDKTILAEMIKEEHASRPGFASFYADDITDQSWQDPETYDHNQWNTVILAYVKQEEIELSEIYWI